MTRRTCFSVLVILGIVFLGLIVSGVVFACKASVLGSRFLYSRTGLFHYYFASFVLFLLSGFVFISMVFVLLLMPNNKDKMRNSK